MGLREEILAIGGEQAVAIIESTHEGAISETVEAYPIFHEIGEYLYRLALADEDLEYAEALYAGVMTLGRVLGAVANEQAATANTASNVIPLPLRTA